MITKANAEKLVQQLRKGLLATQDAIEEIIATKAWKPLGYATFQELWNDRITDIELTGTMRATVVYAMFDEGATDIEAGKAVDGVGGVTASALRQAHRAGMPPKNAAVHVNKMKGRTKSGTTVVRSHERALPQRRNAITVDGFDEAEIAHWNALAKGLGVDRSELFREAVRMGMKMKEWANGTATV